LSIESALALALATFLLAAAVVVVAFFASLSVYVLAAERARRFLESPRAVRNVNRGAGAVLASAGIAVAVS